MLILNWIPHPGRTRVKAIVVKFFAAFAAQPPSSDGEIVDYSGGTETLKKG